MGKTTLARQHAARARGAARIFDLESVEDLALLADPLLTLRVLADEARPRRRFLVLGSASPELLRQSSESLAAAGGARS